MTRFLATNWLWIVFLVVMLAMHRRGGCGMHRHHQHQQDRQPQIGDAEHAHQGGQGKDVP